MGNSQIAIMATHDLLQRSRALSDEWEQFVIGRPSAGSVRQTVIESWKRCRDSGVDPQQRSTPVIVDEEFLYNLLNNAKLYDAALPILKQLGHQTKDTGYLVTLCDSGGRIIFLDGNNPTLRAAERMNFVPGADWSEEVAGTNAIGTSLHLGEAVQIFAAEHFCRGVHSWTCSSAPIRDPLNGELLGAIDLTGQWRDAQPHTLGMVVMSALTIEQRLRETALLLRDRLLNHYLHFLNRWRNDAVFVIDPALRVLRANDKALSLLESEVFVTLERREHWQRMMRQLFAQPVGRDGEEQEVILEEWRMMARVIDVVEQRERIGIVVQLQRRTGRHPGIRQVSADGAAWQGIIGRSQQMQELIARCQTVAHTTVPILLNGESGTGKERFARAIHQSSPRRKKPFIAINCGAIPKELLASELFGYEEGTFTGAIRGGRKGKFEQADGGTLFLDEIGEMPLEAQVHLLRVLQEQEVLRLGGSRPHKINVRVIAATNRDLTCMIGSGQFRPDLYYRLNVVAMTIPPLRERLPDVPLLVRHFIRHFGQRYDKPGVEIDENLMQGLQRYHWPGNIRELENAIEHAVLFSEGECLLPHHFPAAIEKVLKHNVDKQSLEFNRNYSGLNPAQLEERRILLQLLDDTNGNLSEMARRMRVARTTLYRRLQKYQIRI